MKEDVKHKLFMGFRGSFMKIPPLLSEKRTRKGEKGARANRRVKRANPSPSSNLTGGFPGVPLNFT